MPDLTNLTDTELADRFAKCDLRVRQMTQHSPLMDESRRTHVANPRGDGS
jgi:hypothetical protein